VTDPERTATATTTTTATTKRGPGRPRGDVPSDASRVALYLDADLVARVKAHAARLQRQHPGLAVTFSSALRTLALTALEIAEGAERAA
jgi:hypothetical protein